MPIRGHRRLASSSVRACRRSAVAASELEALFGYLVGAGIGVSELTPVVSPLESAFLALTGQQETSR